MSNDVIRSINVFIRSHHDNIHLIRALDFVLSLFAPRHCRTMMKSSKEQQHEKLSPHFPQGSEEMSLAEQALHAYLLQEGTVSISGTGQRAS